MIPRAPVMLGRALVLGDYRQSITVVRSLGRAGLEVTLGTDQRASSTAWSRFLSDVWVYDSATPQRFCNNLEAFLRSERPDFVFAAGEPELRRLIGVAPRLEPLATWVNPDFATLARCLDARAMYELASGLGVPTLPWSAFTSAGDWRSRAHAMGFPVVVKREREALVYETPGGFDAFLAALPRDPAAGAALLQKYVRGARHKCHVAAADGALLAYFEQKVVRAPDDTGIGVAGVSVAPSAALRRHCEALTSALGYTGVGCIEFLVDEHDGDAAFLQFNPGMDSAAVLPYRVGLDYPLLAVQLAAYRKARAAARWDAERLRPQPAAPSYATGKRYHWLHGDLGAWLRQQRAGTARLGRLAARALDMAWLSFTSYHMTFDWRDPLPAVHQFWRTYVKTPQRRLPVSRPLAR